jgi:peptidoglycan-associated lipoprotein
MMKKAALYLAIAVVAGACASKETKTEAPVSEIKAPPTVAGTGEQNRTQGMKPPVGPTGTSITEGRLAKRSVYFDFDSNAVKDEYRDLVQAHSRYLTGEKRDARIRIEGNCDERGSREYNLALGQRRAEAVKKVMTVLGVSDGRIETTSYGEEKPVAPGHDESAWAQNRRADIKYAGE